MVFQGRLRRNTPFVCHLIKQQLQQLVLEQCIFFVYILEKQQLLSKWIFRKKRNEAAFFVTYLLKQY